MDEFWEDYPWSGPKKTGQGLLIILLTCGLFWGSAAGCVGYAIGRHQETAAIKRACDMMISYGWEISQTECVKGLRP